jgi:hypothetical protein
MSASQFRRYTTLPYLLDMLHHKRLTLLDPAKWEDKNDSYFLKIYQEKMAFESVLALCFAEAPETYHHWKIYSGNPSGVCVEFFKDRLLRQFDDKAGFFHAEMQYKTVDILRGGTLHIAEMPFIKRYAYKGEQEYRVIFQSKVERIPVKYVPINLNDISKITVSPWIDTTSYQSIKLTINNIKGCEGIKVKRSTITENDEWKKIGEHAI